MKIGVYYNSKYGNGRIVCEALRSELKKLKINASARGVGEIRARDIPKADIYVFSTPTHIGNAPFRTRGFLRRLPKKHNQKYVLVNTYLGDKSKTINTVTRILESRGYKEIKKPLKIRVLGMQGPLEKSYKEKIKKFAKELSKS